MEENNYKNFIPESVMIAITYKCNSKCKMCNIWQNQKTDDLPLEFFHNLDKRLKYINLSGGEPFLRKDLPDVFRIVKKTCPQSKIIISSNGYETDLIFSVAKEILKIDPKIGIRISLDGIGETHNRIRGVGDIYTKALLSMENLKRIGIKNLGFSFTIMDDNAEEIEEVYKLSRKFGVELALALIQNSEIYFHKNDNAINLKAKIERGLDYIIRSELRGWNLKRWARAYYDFGLQYYLLKGERLIPSGAGFDSLFIDCNGNIYPSNLINILIGSIQKGNLRDIWKGGRACEARKMMREKNISESWVICNLRGQMKRNWIKVGWWILRNKFK